MPHGDERAVDVYLFFPFVLSIFLLGLDPMPDELMFLVGI